jgi:hypothetical protein
MRQGGGRSVRNAHNVGSACHGGPCEEEGMEEVVVTSSLVDVNPFGV